MEAIKETMKQYGVDFEINKDFKIDGPTLSVQCDLDVNLGLDWVNDCVLTKITKRGTQMHCRFLQFTDKLIITFETKVPSYFDSTTKIVGEKVYATTFPDLCWLYSEGTTAQTMEEVVTKPRFEYNPGDLMWLLPSRFVDDLIEMIHTINPEFMSGLMQDAIVYGPYYKINS